MLVRFGVVLESLGSLLHPIAVQVATGAPLAVTHPDMSRQFRLPGRERLVRQDAAMGDYGRMLVPDMCKPVRISDMVECRIRLLGWDVGFLVTRLCPGPKFEQDLSGDRERSMPLRRGLMPQASAAESRPSMLERSDVWVGDDEMREWLDEKTVARAREPLRSSGLVRLSEFEGMAERLRG